MSTQESFDMGSLLDNLFEEITGDDSTKSKKKTTFVGAHDSLFAIDKEDAASIPTCVAYFFGRHGQKLLRAAEFRVKTYTKTLKSGKEYEVHKIVMKCEHGPHIIKKDGKFGMNSCFCLKGLQRQRKAIYEYLLDEGHTDLEYKQIQVAGSSEYELSRWWDPTAWDELTTTL